jgi:Ca2+-binding EF-hand superfamily protein
MNRVNAGRDVELKSKQQEWQHVFRRFDQDGSGSIDGSELQSALTQFGFKLPQHLLQLLLAKYCTSALFEVRLCAR